MGPRRRLGRPTRGKTAAGRLRQVDAFVARYDPALLRRRDGPYRDAAFVDLGFGDHPATTLEAARMLRRLRPDLAVVGVEIDRERAARARAFDTERPLTAFRHGGFDLPLHAEGAPGGARTVRLIRAFNVLRQYEEGEAEAALAILGRQLLPGGLLVEGTSDPSGRVWCAGLLRRPEGVEPLRGAVRRPMRAAADLAESGPVTPALVGEGLVFGLRWRSDFHPASFRAVLPKSWHHRVVPGEPVHRFFEAWSRAWDETRAYAVWGQRFAFARCAEHLAASGFRVDLRRRFLRRGTLLWRDGNPWPPREQGGVHR